jgi:N-succinyldiaminopimelate aminotransferase
VYEEVYFTEHPPPPTWARDDLISRTVAIHSMSKSFAMAGARVGFAHGPAEVMRALRAAHTYQDYGPSKAFQLIAAEVLKNGDDWMTQTRKRYAEAGALMSRLLGVPNAQGGTFAFVRAPEPCDELLIRLADNGVLLTPGSVCGKDFEDWYRLCFTVLPPEELEQALSIIVGG